MYPKSIMMQHVQNTLADFEFDLQSNHCKLGNFIHTGYGIFPGIGNSPSQRFAENSQFNTPKQSGGVFGVDDSWSVIPN